uniref:Uncharacterized protein n=1 Tax=Poecilia formosa TaxID=48698 RepID=A0A096LUB5_POEFO
LEHSFKVKLEVRGKSVCHQDRKLQAASLFTEKRKQKILNLVTRKRKSKPKDL